MNFVDILQEKAAPYLRMLRLKHQTIGTIVYLLGLLDANYFKSPQVFIIFFGLILISMAGFVINDYFDSYDTDKFSYRDRVKDKISGKVVFIIWFLFNLSGAIILTLNGLFWQAAILFVVNTLYSSPPVRFKAHFLWDLVATFIQGAVAYSIGSALAGNGSISALLGVPFVTLTLFMAAGEFILLTMDYGADKAAGLKNTNVTLGYVWLIRISKILLIFSAFSFAVLCYLHQSWWYYPMIAALPYFGYAVGRLREATDTKKDLKSLLNISYTRAMTTMILITGYLIVVFIYGFLKYHQVSLFR